MNQNPRRDGNPNRFDGKKLDKKATRGVLIRLLGYVFKHWWLFIIALLFTLLSNFLALLGPEFSGAAIDCVVAEGGVDFDGVYSNVLRMLICYVASAILSYALAVIMIHLSQRVVFTMRKQVFEKLNTLPVGFFDTTSTGDIISRISYDIDTVNSSLSHDLIQVMTSIYTVLGSLIFMWRISKPMLIVFVITVPISVLFTRYRSKKVRPLFRERSRKLGELNGYAEEMLSGVRSIRAYGKADEVIAGFDKKNKDATDTYYNAEYHAAALGPGVNFINNLSICLVAMLGGILYMYSQNGTVAEGAVLFITLGGVAKFVQYSRKFAGPINEFANIMHEFQSAFSAAERIFRIIDEPSEAPDLPGAVALPAPTGDVVFDNVTFGYVADKTVLKNVSFSAPAGKTVAVVGPTGAGKTTLINLLMRFYDVNGGAILLDGENVCNIVRRDLRRSYTMVLQDTWLFSGTIRDNIVYGKENATDAEVRAAAAAARIDGFIEKLPQGYDTVLTDDAVNISKGQKQLITIARAILSDAPMLILDEATSNVDSRTEIKIGEAMRALMENRTSFVIAHRLSTIKNADLILVVKDGGIAESGTHDELLRLGGFYSTLYNSQFT